MKELKVTTTWGLGRAAHRHVVFLNTDSEIPTATISSNAGHTHQIEFIPPTETSDGGFFIHPDLDGHTHQIVDVKLVKPKSSENDEQIIADVISLTKTALELEGESLKAAEESEKFYCGEQWKQHEKQHLESLRRAALTVNFIQRNVDELCGYQRENRTDIHFLPKEDGDQRTADILNLICKVILDNCDFSLEESLVFEDAAITGRGVFNVFIDFSKDLRGEAKVERFLWDGVLFGAHERTDASDAEYIVKHKLYSLAKLKQLYPDKAELLTANYDLLSDVNGADHIQYPSHQYELSENKMTISGGGNTLEMVDLAKKEYRIIECIRKKYTTSTVIANPNEELYFNADGWSPKDINAAKFLPGFFVIPRTQTQYRITRICSGVVLSDENPADLPTNEFFIVPVYARKRRNKFWGKVEPAKDPQREINKRHSQMTDIGNTMAAYNYFIDANTFPDNEKNNFISNATSPGAVFEVNDTNKLPVKWEGGKFPTEIAQIMALDKEHLQEIMNISVPPTNPYSSGDFLIEAQKLRLRGNEYLFDNLSFAKKRIGLLLVHLIRRYYPAERIFRIVNSVGKPDDKIGDASLQDYPLDEIQALLNNLDVTKYDVSVSERSFSPTMKMAIFKYMSELAKAGMPIPPEMLIEFLDVPDNVRVKMQQSIQQQQAAQAEAQQATQQSEVVKSLIGQGLIPPQVQEQYGLAGQQEQPQPDVQQMDGMENTYGNVAQY